MDSIVKNNFTMWTDGNNTYDNKAIAQVSDKCFACLSINAKDHHW